MQNRLCPPRIHTLVVRPLKIIFFVLFTILLRLGAYLYMCVLYKRVPNHRIFVIILNIICHPEYDLLLFLENARRGNFDKSFFCENEDRSGGGLFFFGLRIIYDCEKTSAHIIYYT